MKYFDYTVRNSVNFYFQRYDQEYHDKIFGNIET